MIHTHIHKHTMNIESKANCYSVIIWWSVYVWGLWYDVVLCSGEKERKKGKRIRWLSLNTIDNRYEYISATPQNNNELITMKFTHFFSLSFGADFLFCFSLAWSCYTSYLFIRLMIIDWVIGSLIFFAVVFTTFLLFIILMDNNNPSDSYLYLYYYWMYRMNILSSQKYYRLVFITTS